MTTKFLSNLTSRKLLSKFSLFTPILLLLNLFFYRDVHCQNNSFWITFKDKGSACINKKYVSEKAIENRIMLGIAPFQYSDIPPARAYKETVAKYGRIHGQSKWLNAVLVELDVNGKTALQCLPFVSSIVPAKTLLHVASHPFHSQTLSATALEQVGASAFHKEHLSGKDVYIGIIDGNFVGAHENPLLSHLFKNNKLLGTRDFVTKTAMNFSKVDQGFEDNHGTLVWQLIAGKENDIRYGSSTDASFYLARTDVTDREFREEEQFWIAALEWMDSLGVRLVNSSLGYSLDFDNPLENHKPEDMNGKGMMAKAAQIAVEEKGMIIVLSAGNDGNNEAWRITSTPADAKGVISVGATDESGLKLPHSAVGSPFVPYLKPNVVCFSTAGTSFSAPVITGLIACMLEKNPLLKSQDVNTILEQSSHLFPYGNNYMGMGIPNARKILSLMNKEPSTSIKGVHEIKHRGDKVTFSAKNNDSNPATVFHKKDRSCVVSQDYLLPPRRKFVIRKPAGCSRSTVVMTGNVVEIVWE